MTKLLTSSWMTAVLSAVVYLGATVAFWKTPAPPPAASTLADAASAPNAPSWEFSNPEADQLMAELKAEKKTLSKKEQDLNDLSVRLQSERTELTQASASVQQLQSNFDSSVLRIHEEETINLKKLAKVYAEMAPESAANIFAEMDDTAVVKIMVFMKDTDTAGIFEAMAKKGQPDAKRAATLSDRLRLASFRNPTAK